MADQEFSIKLTADGTDLKEGTDQAKEAISMLGDFIGISVPEAVQKMLAQTELIGPAFEEAFAPLAVISLIKSIADAVDALEKQKQAQEEEARAAFAAGDSIGKMAESIHLSNLQIKDQISVLQKKPATNGIAIVLGQAAQKADELTAAIGKALAEQDKLLASVAQGQLARLLLGSGDIEKMANKLFDENKRVNQELQDLDEKRRLDASEGNAKEVAEDRQKYKDKLAEFKTFLGEQQKALDQWKKNRAEALQQDSVNTGPEGGVTPGESATEAMQHATQEAQELQRALNIVRIATLDSVSVFKQLKENSDLGVKEKYAEASRAAQDFFDKTLHAYSTLASEIKKQADEQAEDAARAANALVAANEKIAQEGERIVAAWQKQSQTSQKIDQLTRDLADGQAEHNAKLSVALGYETQEQAAQRALKQVEQDKKTALDEINSRLTAQIAIVKQLGEATMNGMLGGPEQKAAYQKAVTDYQNLKIQELQLEKKYDSQIEGLQSKLSDSFVVQLRKQMLAWQDVHKEMEAMFTSTLNSMNSALESFITTGKFNWTSLATSAINEIVKIGLQWAESQITMMILGKTTGKETAGSNIMASAASGAAAAGASVAAIPAVGWSMVEAVSAATYGILAAYEAGIAGFALGGIVPATGLALVHQGERILPASMSGTGAGVGGGHTFNLHYHISGLDGADITDTYKSKLRPLMQRDLLKILKKAGVS